MTRTRSIAGGLFLFALILPAAAHHSGAMFDSTKRVDLSQPYQDHVRMTLTPSVVNAATARVALVTGADKATNVARWLEGDGAGLPIARVTPDDALVALDAAAAADMGQAGSGGA